MSTEGTQAIADELEAPAIETQAEPESDIEREVAETEAPEGEAEGGEQQPELVEVEINGKKYAVPVDLKDGYLMHGDYTRKTQEAAEIRKGAEQRAADAAALYQSGEDFIQAKAVMMNLDSQLQQFQNLDWNRFEQEDPIGAQSMWRQFQTMKEQRGQVAEHLTKTQNERNAKAEQDTANRLQETRQFAEKEIPGWTPDIDVKVTKFAQGLGFGPEQLRAAMSPTIYKMLHLAWIGDQSIQRQKTAAPRPQQQLKPLNTVTPKGNPPGRKAVGDMNVDEMAAYLNKR